MNTTKMTNKLILNLLIGGGLLAGLASCADESISLKDVNYPLYERLDTAGYQGYELVWSEEFDQDGRPNSAYWNYDEGYMRNEEAQDYLKDDPRTSRIEGGDLVIEAFKDPHEGINKWTGEPYHFDYSSAELTTKGKVDFQYGRLDIAAKIPTGRGVWPAFWMRPTDALEGKYAEIDIMEYVWGNTEDHNTYYVTLHTQATNDGLAERWSGNTSSPTLESNYHLYSLVWDEEMIQVLFDNEVVCTAEKEEGMTLDYWPFDQPFYLIMNIAVGGGWGGSWGIDETIFPKQMNVKYIRYYKPIEASVPGGGDGNVDDGAEYVVNGGFETDLDASMQPKVGPRSDIEYENALNFVNRWWVLNHNTAALTIDKTTGADDTNRSLKYSNSKLGNWYSTDMSMCIQNVPAGKYTLSFWAKSNQATAPLAVDLAMCETQEDMKLLYKYWKSLVKENGETIIKQVEVGASGDLYCLTSETVGTEWKQYSITLDIPENILLKLVLKPHTSGTPGLNSYKLQTPADNLEFWFDEFSLKEKK